MNDSFIEENKHLEVYLESNAPATSAEMKKGAFASTSLEKDM